jgi:hypothetical protein
MSVQPVLKGAAGKCMFFLRKPEDGWDEWQNGRKKCAFGHVQLARKKRNLVGKAFLLKPSLKKGQITIANRHCLF